MRKTKTTINRLPSAEQRPVNSTGKASINSSLISCTRDCGVTIYKEKRQFVCYIICRTSRLLSFILRRSESEESRKREELFRGVLRSRAFMYAMPHGLL